MHAYVVRVLISNSIGIDLARNPERTTIHGSSYVALYACLYMQCVWLIY